jgi:hypothetical protein
VSESTRAGTPRRCWRLGVCDPMGAEDADGAEGPGAIPGMHQTDTIGHRHRHLGRDLGRGRDGEILVKPGDLVYPAGP